MLIFNSPQFFITAKMTIRFYVFVLSAFFALLFFSCTSSKVLHYSAGEAICNTSDRSIHYDSLVFEHLKDNDTGGCYAILKEKFSSRSLRAAKNFRLYGLLGKYFTENNSEKKLALRLKISNICNIHALEIADFAATIQCEKARINETFEHLEGEKNKSLARATVASIIIGGVAGTLASVLNLAGIDNETEQGINITGAVIGTYLGFKSFKVKKKIIFKHNHNELREVWEQPASSEFIPLSVYVFLTTPFLYQNNLTTGLEYLKNQWIIKGFTENKKRNDLIFGEGGEYDSDALETRLQMLDTFDGEIRIMQYDLKRLMQEIILNEK